MFGLSLVLKAHLVQVSPSPAHETHFRLKRDLPAALVFGTGRGWNPIPTHEENKIAPILVFDESRIFNLISLFVKIGLQRHREADPDKEGNPVEILLSSKNRTEAILFFESVFNASKRLFEK